MMTSSCLHSGLKRILSQSLVVGTLAVLGLLSGVAPELSKNSATLVFSTSAYAQSAVSDEEVTKYAQAVLRMEPLRQSAYGEIKKILGSSSIPEIVCGVPQSLNALPGEARSVAQNYCTQSAAIVANYFPGGTTTRFNEITSLMQSNGNLRTRIQNELVRLQR